MIILGTNYAFAQLIDYEIYGKTINGIPTVCSVTPLASNLDEGQKKMLLAEAKASTFEWKVQMQTFDRYNKGNWEINYKDIQDESQITKNNCNVVIIFLATPSDPSLYYNTLGITTIPEHYDDPIIIEIYYQNIGLCQTEDEYYIYTWSCYDAGTLTTRSIGNTIRHELGHALGLGHYVSSNPDLNKSWATGDSPAPSIMIIMEHVNPYQIQIKPIDVEKLKSIYGDSGFVWNLEEEKQSTEQNVLTMPRTEKSIPSWIKSNAGWWAEKQITDNEFLKGIAYMIKERIIIVPYGSENYLELEADSGATILVSYSVLANEATLEFTFLDEYNRPLNEVKYGYSLIDASGIEVAENIGEDPELPGIDAKSGKGIQNIPVLNKESHDIFVAIFGQGEMYDQRYAGVSDGVLEIPAKKTSSIPEWVRTNAQWWSNGLISDDDFSRGIQYLIENGILTV